MTCEEVDSLMKDKKPWECTRAEVGALVNHFYCCPTHWIRYLATRVKMEKEGITVSEEVERKNQEVAEAVKKDWEALS